MAKQNTQQQPEPAATERSHRCQLQCRKAVAAILIILGMGSCSWARNGNKKTTAPAAPSDPGYLLALAAANRFLHAWQMGDLAEGMVLVSDGVRHSQNLDALENFFSAGADRAFEISTGRGNRGRYSFPVVLVQLKGSTAIRKASEMILVNTGKNDWAVDKLP